MYVYIPINTYVRIYIYIYICVCMYVYTCMYMYIYIYIYIFTYMHKSVTGWFPPLPSISEESGKSTTSTNKIKTKNNRFKQIYKIWENWNILQNQNNKKRNIEHSKKISISNKTSKNHTIELAPPKGRSGPRRV